MCAVITNIPHEWCDKASSSHVTECCAKSECYNAYNVELNPMCNCLLNK